jgi:ABC-2 type transport system permease protein
MSASGEPARGLGRVQYLAVVRKEVLQTLRDRRIMFMLVAAPLIQTVVLGFAVNFEVDRVPAAVADMDQSPESRENLRRLLADETLRRAAAAPSAEAAVAMLDQDRAAVAVVIPPRFGADLQAGRPAEVQVVVDGADPNRANVAAGAAQRYFGEVGQALARERLARQGLPAPPRVEVAPRVLFNPSLKTPPYIIPGILAMLLIIVTTIVTAMGLAREREVGTLEQVMVTPIHPLWLLAGKMTPFVAIGFFDVLLLLAVGTWVFQVPIRGSLGVLALGTLLYLFTTLGTGLLISTVSQTQQQAFLGGFLFVLPAVLLSGIMTPIHSMPPWMQALTRLNPLRYYAELNRANLMKAAGLADVWPQLLALAIFGAAIFGLATLRFRKRIV